ncbi:MAG: response regulator [Bacteroidota bacterium]
MPTSTLKLHILDDTPDVASQLKEDLEDKISPVIHLHEEDNIAELISDSDINDVFLIDINLGPGKTRKGIKIIKLLREEFQDALIIAYTANIGEYVYRDCLQAGADSFILKTAADWDKTIKSIEIYIKRYINRLDRQIKNWTSIKRINCYIKDINPSEKLAELYCEDEENDAVKFEKIVSYEKLESLKPFQIGTPVLITIFESSDETRIKFSKAERNHFERQSKDLPNYDFLSDPDIFRPRNE